MLPKSPRLRRILFAYTVNELGTWFAYVALALGVYDHTHSALATAALFFARGLLPAVLAPLLVARVERSRRRGGLAALYALEGALALALALALWRFWLPGVLALIALDGVAAVAATALVRASAANIASEDAAGGQDASERAQRQANAALNLGFMFTFAVGPAIGGAVVHALGGPVAMLLDGASFALCSLLLVELRMHAGAGTEASVRARLVVVWRHVQGMPALRALLLTEAVAIVVFASVEPVEVVYAKATLAAGDVGLGLLLGLWGAGAALGSVVFARSVHRSLAPMLIGGTLCVGIAYLGFSAAPTLAAACPASLIGGVGNGIQWPALVSAVQRVTPAGMQGRLMGALGSMSALCPTIGFALGGTLAALTSTRVALLTAGVVASIATLAFTRLSLGRLPSAQPEPLDGATEALTR